MAKATDTNTGQLGFDALLVETDAQNRKRRFDRQTAHLPGSMADALDHYRNLLEDHHAAMLAAACDEVVRIREEARLLAAKLNGGSFGMLAGPDAPGNVLMDRTAVPADRLPLWGQTGRFVVEVAGIPVAVDMQGMLGIASRSHWLGFAIHAADWQQPFLSETGYRSFLGVGMELQPGITPEAFVTRILSAYLDDALNGKPVVIGERYRRED
jgi:hypothetical protein